jgi:hypothetical protein
MAIDWDGIVAANVRKIVEAAKESNIADPICVLVDVAKAQVGEVPVGAMLLITETEMKGAVPIADPDGKIELACLPVGKDQLIQAFEKDEDVTMMRRMKTGDSVAAWAYCIDGDDRKCIDIHLATPESN